MPLPRMIKIRQHFPCERVTNLGETISIQIKGLGLAIKPGMRIAVTAGSRGIANIAEITKETITVLRSLGAEPFIVPAMGSHGGATAEGQVEVLESLGITEAYCQAPICSSMDVVEVGHLPGFGPVYMDRLAREADGVFLIGRIKLHTDYRSPKHLESGLAKMSVIGLGKHKQALNIHSYGVEGLRDYIPQAAAVILQETNVLGGLAILENAYEQTAKLEAVAAKDILTREPILLQESSRLMPRLPVDDMDVLFVDVIGKDYSGTGFDTNIIGRIRIHGVEEPGSPRIRYIIAGDLSPASHGNALGIGLADFTTKRLVSKIDHQITKENIVTSTFVLRAMIPLTLDNDREALETALRCSWGTPAEKARIVRIPNTLHLGTLFVSEALLSEVQQLHHIEILSEAEPPSFDNDGFFAPWED